MMHHPESHGDESASRAKYAEPHSSFHDRHYGVYLARVTDIEDPLKQNRIKARYHWLEEEGGPEMESGWMHQVTPFAGPTNMARGRVFGMDWPLPEVHSLVVIAFLDGNIHDPVWFGQPRYWEGGTGAPRLEKDDRKDWALRIALQNGFEFGVDTEANAYMVVPGNLRVKVQCSAFLSARGVFTFVAAKVRGLAESVMRLIAATHDQVNYSRQPVEDPDLREMRIDAMDGVPGRRDPGIGRIEDTE